MGTPPSLGVVDEQPPENPWDPRYQAERNSIHKAWVEEVFGTAREFSWRVLQANYDSRSGSSGIYFSYTA